LAEHSPGNLGTHEFRRGGGKIYAVAMMHEDGIGPSRILLRDQLLGLFPEGYKVALPEMGCAFAFSSDVQEAEINKLQGLIDDCYRKGTRPLAAGIYTPEDLLPATESI
jgi:hypothetical protein